ncbi:MAG TPA: copper chaperone PCu(A)C [Steroidobacteraceae bacterium]|jgi:hypothetical protein|nr:copper chaperone PCu(A)C [Steroidobacteraceae bacterium]
MISPLVRRVGLALLPALAVCIVIRMPAAAAADSAGAQSERGVRVAQAWIRWLPANLPAGGYLTLVNDSARPVTLVAVQSPAYASVALHRTLTSGGTARMVPVAAIPVPAHATLDFASLGYHLMLMQARQPVQPGQQLPLTLQFADGGTLQISAQVKPPTWVPPSAHAGATMPGMPDMPGMGKMPGKSH